MISISKNLFVENLYANNLGIRNILNMNSDQITFDLYQNLKFFLLCSAFQDIKSNPLVFAYLQKVFVPSFFLEDFKFPEANKFLDYNMYIGPVRIR